MFNLLPKDTVFFDLWESIAKHMVASARHLQTLIKDHPRIDGPLQLIRNEEHAADGLAHQALDRLDRTFITPFDREDIHTLIGELDDIVDAIDALAKRFPLFHVEEIPPMFAKQAQVLLDATLAVEQAVGKLRKTRKMSELSENLIEIHRLESVGDDNHHSAMSGLFSGQVDPLRVIKWKELYDYIEEAIDGCEDVGNVLERIVLKNG
jgi:uncharacterized protein Yka (UPF0111/DUF47 family)